MAPAKMIKHEGFAIRHHQAMKYHKTSEGGVSHPVQKGWSVRNCLMPGGSRRCAGIYNPVDHLDPSSSRLLSFGCAVFGDEIFPVSCFNWLTGTYASLASDHVLVFRQFGIWVLKPWVVGDCQSRSNKLIDPSIDSKATSPHLHGYSASRFEPHILNYCILSGKHCFGCAYFLATLGMTCGKLLAMSNNPARWRSTVPCCLITHPTYVVIYSCNIFCN